MCEGLGLGVAGAKCIFGSKEFPYAWNLKHKGRPGEQPGLREAWAPILRGHGMTVKTNLSSHWHGLILYVRTVEEGPII